MPTSPFPHSPLLFPLNTYHQTTIAALFIYITYCRILSMFTEISLVPTIAPDIQKELKKYLFNECTRECKNNKQPTPKSHLSWIGFPDFPKLFCIELSLSLLCVCAFGYLSHSPCLLFQHDNHFLILFVVPMEQCLACCNSTAKFWVNEWINELLLWCKISYQMVSPSYTGVSICVHLSLKIRQGLFCSFSHAKWLYCILFCFFDCSL